MATTYSNLYLDARRVLKKNGVDEAQLEARELLCFASEKNRNRLFQDMGLYAPDNVENRFRELMERRLKGEPVAYIIGEWDFYGLTLDICRDVLIPRPETEVLVDRGILFVRDLPEGTRVLDLCAGSGCIGLAVAENCLNTKVMLAEWSEDALRVCRQNIRRCGLTDRVSACRANALESAPSSLRDYDLLLCNPPYIPTEDLEGLDHSVRDFEPRMALDGGPEGLKFFHSIATGWKSALRTGGKLVFEVGYDQAPAVEQILMKNGYSDIQTFRDPAGHWRAVEGIPD